jgi:hypothetical protein
MCSTSSFNQIPGCNKSMSSFWTSTLKADTTVPGGSASYSCTWSSWSCESRIGSDFGCFRSLILLEIFSCFSSVFWYIGVDMGGILAGSPLMWVWIKVHPEHAIYFISKVIKPQIMSIFSINFRLRRGWSCGSAIISGFGMWVLHDCFEKAN